jgi:hypothetical protein
MWRDGGRRACGALFETAQAVDNSVADIQIVLPTDFDLVSAYHAFHAVEHGHESQPTYRHQFKTSQPWHIDFGFVPVAWMNHLVSVEVIDGEG